MKKHAFLIGVKDYRYLNLLYTPINDIRRIGHILESVYQFKVNYCENPGREELIRFLSTIDKKLKKDRSAQVVVYFAGHGLATDSELGIQGYVIPVDGEKSNAATWVEMGVIVEILRTCQIHHLLLVLDCCFSGAIRWASTRRGQSIRGLLNREDRLFSQHYRYFTKHTAWQVLTSTSHRQVALDRLGSRFEQWGAFSPFAKLFSDGLEGEADLNQDGIVSISELHSFLQNKLAIISGEASTLQNAGLYPLPEHDSGEFLFIEKSFEVNELPILSYRNPYRGLNAYEPEDAPLFFGREEAKSKLLELVRTHPLIVAVGASGVGKSSLVKAGIVPSIDVDQKVRVIRPGRHPLAAVPSPESFDVLVIDQLEEIITQSEHKEYAPEFMNRIRELIAANKKVICTLRIDYEAQISKEILTPYWDAGRYLVPALRAEEFREIIVKPAARAGRFYHPTALVEKILEDVVHYPGSLPLLSFTLSMLFERCKEDPFREILAKDYEEMGRIAGALQQKADQIVDELESRERAILRNILLRMTAQEGGEISKKRVLIKELDFGPAQREGVKKVISRLETERLIVADQQEDGTLFIEPAHDALVKSWGTLRKWLRETGDDKMMRRRALALAVREFQTRERQEQHLWHNNPKLSELTLRPGNWWKALLQWFRPSGLAFVHHDWLTVPERDFLIKSQRKRKVNLNRLWGAVAGVIIVLSFAFAFARSQQRLAEGRDRESRALYLASEAWNMRFNDPTQALRLLQRAYADHSGHPAILEKIYPIYSLKDSLPFYRLSLRHNRGVLSISLSQNEQHILTASSDSSAVLWRISDGQKVRTFRHRGVVYNADFSKAGDLIVTSSADSTAALWRLSGARLKTLQHHDWVRSAVFVPGDSLVLTTSIDDTARVWNVKGELIAQMPHDESLDRVKVSPDGSQLITFWEDDIRQYATLWSAGGKLIEHLSQNDSICKAAFSPDTNYVLSLPGDRSAQLRKKNGDLVRSLSHDAVVHGCSFTSAGNVIVTLSKDNTVRLWDLEGRCLQVLRHSQRVKEYAVSPDGERIVAHTADKKLIVWGRNGEKLTEILYSRYVKLGSFSPNGQFFTVISDDMLVEGEGWTKLFDRNGRLITTFLSEGYVKGTRFSSDGEFLLVAWGNLLEKNKAGVKLWFIDNSVIDPYQNDGEIRSLVQSTDHRWLVTVSEGDSIRVRNKEGQIISGFPHEGLIRYTQVSPDGNMILSGGENQLRVWRRNGEPVVSILEREGIQTATFSSRSTHILTTTYGRMVRLWNLQGDSVFTFVHSNVVNMASFTPDDKKIITASQDSTAAIWSLKDGRRLLRIEHDEEVNFAVFSPDQKYIVTASGTTLRIWDQSGRLVKTLPHESVMYDVHFSPNGRLLLTPSTPAVLWDWEGNPLAVFRHDNYVNNAVFSSDGRLVLTSSADRRAKLWDLAGNLLATYQHDHYVQNALFIEENKKILIDPDESPPKSWMTPRGVLERIDTRIAPLSMGSKDKYGLE